MKITLLKKKEQTNNETQEKLIVSEEKDFAIPFAPASAYLEYLELEAKRENPRLLKVNDVRQMAELIVKTYGDQFTVEEFLQGVPSYLLVETIDKFVEDLTTNPYPTKSTDQVGNSGKKAD